MGTVAADDPLADRLPRRLLSIEPELRGQAF